MSEYKNWKVETDAEGIVWLRIDKADSSANVLSAELMEELENECRSGKIICGECKAILAERVKKFLREHQRKREKARDVVDDFFFK